MPLWRTTRVRGHFLYPSNRASNMLLVNCRQGKNQQDFHGLMMAHGYNMLGRCIMAFTHGASSSFSPGLIGWARYNIVCRDSQQTMASDASLQSLQEHRNIRQREKETLYLLAVSSSPLVKREGHWFSERSQTSQLRVLSHGACPPAHGPWHSHYCSIPQPEACNWRNRRNRMQQIWKTWEKWELLRHKKLKKPLKPLQSLKDPSCHCCVRLLKHGVQPPWPQFESKNSDWWKDMTNRKLKCDIQPKSSSNRPWTRGGCNLLAWRCRQLQLTTILQELDRIGMFPFSFRCFPCRSSARSHWLNWAPGR